MNADSCETKRLRALAGVPNGTEASRAFICIANVASSVRDSSCCLKALLQVLEEQHGLGGIALAGTSDDANKKAADVAAYINCLLQRVP